MDLELRGRVALVCAASQGLGRAVAAGLAAEGARVALCARSEATLIDAAGAIAAQTGADLLPIAADVSRAADCRRLVDTTVQRWGRLDVLVNNSGGPPSGPFAAHDDATWAGAIDGTLMNVVRLIRLAVPHMQSAGGGRIVNLTSISVKQPVDNLLLSNAIRPAVIGLAKTLADELGPSGILVNNVCPGLHETARLRALAATRAGKSGRTVDEELAALAAGVPLRRLGRPEELAALVVFLCSARASYITGTSILVDGGSYRGLM